MKYYIFFIFFLLSAILVSAGNIQRLDFSDKDSMPVTLSEKDAVRFNFKDKEHKIMVGEIVEEKNMVKLTVFIEGAEVPSYTTLSPKYNLLRLDFERDDVMDMDVKLMKVENNKVTLLFKKVNELGSSAKISGSTSVLSNKFSIVKDKWAYALIILIILVALILNSRFVLKTYRKVRKKL